MGRKKLARTMVIGFIFAVLVFLLVLNFFQGDVSDTTKTNNAAPSKQSSIKLDKSPALSASKSAKSSSLIVMPAKPAKDAISFIEPTKFKTGVYWKIEKAGVEPSYLLGTIHVDDPRVLKILKTISENFNKAKTLCTEIKMDYVAKVKFSMEMIYTDKKTLKGEIGEKLYNRILAELKQKKIPVGNINKLKPWAAWVLLIMPIPKSEVLDERLFRNAILQQKNICGLEDIDEHIGVFTKTPLNHLIKMIEFSLDNLPLIAKQSSQLIDIYIERNLEKMFALMKNSPMVDDEELINDYFYRLVIRRNVIMVNAILPRLKPGNAFFAVGALHLPGKTGILQLLESKGYKLSKLY